MYYNKKLTPNAQSLRKAMTKEENLLWYRFLRRYPVQFRRQYVVGEYIVDFYCHKAHLAVELDGSGHYEPQAQKYDEKRTQELAQMGVSVVRYTNLEVMREFSRVCEDIDRRVKEALV